MSFWAERDIDAGGIIMTASHNPGGVHGDFGIKYNMGNGGPAPESVTEAIYQHTLKISSYKTAEGLAAVDVSHVGESRVLNGLVVEVVDPVENYASHMQGAERVESAVVHLVLTGVGGAQRCLIFR
jgi:phosphoglucomutase